MDEKELGQSDYIKWLNFVFSSQFRRHFFGQ